MTPKNLSNHQNDPTHGNLKYPAKKEKNNHLVCIYHGVDTLWTFPKQTIYENGNIFENPIFYLPQDDYIIIPIKMAFGNCIELAIQFVYQSSSCLQVVNPPNLQDSPLLDGSMLLVKSSFFCVYPLLHFRKTSPSLVFHRTSPWFHSEIKGTPHLYPLVNIQKAIESGHRNSEFSHEKW